MQHASRALCANCPRVDCVWISPSDAGLAVSVPLAQAELTEKVAKMYSAEANTVFLYGFRTAFGGGKSTGFGLVYDSPEAAKKLVPKYLQIRVRTATCCAVDETRFLRTTACAGQSAQPSSEPRAPRCVCVLQAGIADRVTKSRKQTKERKNRAMKVRGVKKVRTRRLACSCCNAAAAVRHHSLTLVHASCRCCAAPQTKMTDKKKVSL